MKIAIDAGHGLHTPGKCTPDGMREFEFNNAVALMVRDIVQEYEDTTVYFVHDVTGQIDIMLLARANAANSKQADVYVSIHANAYGSSWNNSNGIETYIHPNASKEAIKVAVAIQMHLVQETGLKNRGVKTANFQVLRDTDMPAVLAECGFMTNQKEAALLKSNEYRKKCATAITNALVEVYKLKPIKKVEKLFDPGSPTLKKSVEYVLYRMELEGDLTDKWRHKLLDGTLTESEAIGLVFTAIERGFIHNKFSNK